MEARSARVSKARARARFYEITSLSARWWCLIWERNGRDSKVCRKKEKKKVMIKVIQMVCRVVQKVFAVQSGIARTFGCVRHGCVFC